MSQTAAPRIRSSTADGALPHGVTVFDDQYPGVANLDPDLLQALREAAMDAAADGIEFYVNSGWRSPRYQHQLLREAVSTHGSESEAARWVATPDTSAHVSGNAVDIGPFEAKAWLSEHGATYGLCQIYRNEPWHYELRPEAIYRGCPPMYADPTHDPRMRRSPMLAGAEHLDGLGDALGAGGVPLGLGDPPDELLAVRVGQRLEGGLRHGG